jgi:hypothetical protein
MGQASTAVSDGIDVATDQLQQYMAHLNFVFVVRVLYLLHYEKAIIAIDDRKLQRKFGVYTIKVNTPVHRHFTSSGTDCPSHLYM